MSKQSDLDNHANQLNPNNDAYWQSRDEEERPADWESASSKTTRTTRGTRSPVGRSSADRRPGRCPDGGEAAPHSS